MPLKTAAADRLVTGAAFLVVLLAASLVAAIPIYADAVAESSLRARLARVPVEDANVQLVVDVFAGGAESGLDRRVRELVDETFAGVPVTTFASGESEPFAGKPSASSTSSSRTPSSRPAGGPRRARAPSRSRCRPRWGPTSGCVSATSSRRRAGSTRRIV